MFEILKNIGFECSEIMPINIEKIVHKHFPLNASQ